MKAFANVDHQHYSHLGIGSLGDIQEREIAKKEDVEMKRMDSLARPLKSTTMVASPLYKMDDAHDIPDGS